MVMDFLKKFFPDFNINFNYNDNRKIILTDKSISIGDKVIKGSKNVDKFLNGLSEYNNKDSYPAQIIHQDLYESYEDYEQLTIFDNQSIKKLLNVLPNSEIECILMARRVKLLYYEKKDDIAKKLHSKLCENYPEKGSKVYNLISSNYFDDMIIPFIEVFKSQYEDNYVEKYRDFYFDIIKFFPIAVFVSNYTTKDQIIKNISERLKLSIPFIRVHTIGELNIKKVDEAIDEIYPNKRPSIQDNRFTTPSGLKSQILEIRLSEEKYN